MSTNYNRIRPELQTYYLVVTFTLSHFSKLAPSPSLSAPTPLLNIIIKHCRRPSFTLSPSFIFQLLFPPPFLSPSLSSSCFHSSIFLPTPPPPPPHPVGDRRHGNAHAPMQVQYILVTSTPVGHGIRVPITRIDCIIVLMSSNRPFRRGGVGGGDG